MKLIEHHIRSESKKAKPDQGLLNQLKKMLDKKKVLFEDFTETGRFMNEKEFRKNNPNEVLEWQCTDVVVYAGKLYLQVLKTGVYRLRTNDSKGGIESHSLDDMEKMMWSLVASKALNDDK